jgi:hypothetical protein
VQRNPHVVLERDGDMLRIVVYVSALIAGAISLLFIQAATTPFILITGVMIGIAIPLLDTLSANARYLKLAWYSTKYRNRTIRLSVSYLFRIKVDEMYLLVKGKRWRQYQPVGGVYKFSPGAKAFMDEIGARNDDLVRFDATSLNDLRIRIPGQNLFRFVRWFESGHSRESSPWREFYEELIKPGMLPLKDFPYILEDFIQRDIRPIRFSEYAKSWELLIADIYELIPTQDQLAALRKLKVDGHPDLVWATEDQIRRRGAIPGEDQQIEISPTAGWAL